MPTESLSVQRIGESDYPCILTELLRLEFLKTCRVTGRTITLCALSTSPHIDTNPSQKFEDLPKC